jgi:hypothetical protein
MSALLCWSVVLVAHDNPPTDLHLIGDHWTAWDPPTSFPEGAEVYVVQPGDTLWDLSNSFYGDPYLWPQLWERNRYILDAHWIYPGDPLVIGVEVTPVEEVIAAADMGEGAEGEEDELRLDRSIPPPVALGAEDDIYCGGYIAGPDEQFPFEIIGTEYTGSSYGSSLKAGYGRYSGVILNLSVSDIVYVDGGRQAGLTPGEVFTVINAEGPVKHPLDRSTVGHLYRYQGRVRVLSVQEDTGIAEVVHACRGISVGNLLKPFTPEPVPMARHSGVIPVNDPMPRENLQEAPTVILSAEGIESLGQGHVVYIDRGALHDVTPGDIFTVYRVTPPGLPLLPVGEVGVLSVGDETSLARIIESRSLMHVGDRLDPEPR